MTSVVDIANRSLLLAGIPKHLTTLTQDSEEAATLNTLIGPIRDDLIRMAPWNCVTKFANLTYITSLPTTPENAGPGPPLWVPGTPPPPWAYEYQYPVDCIRARFILPQYTALAGGVPIYPPGTATGAQQVGWTGPALKFNVITDQFFAINTITILTPGLGYVVGETITLGQPTIAITQGGVVYTMPVGAPAQVQVLSVDGSGAILTVAIVNQIQGESPPLGGSYFNGTVITPSLFAQASSSANGTGATFTGIMSTLGPQRVIVCNQEQAILCYNTQITDPNIMDPFFQDAWAHILGARVAYTLRQDKDLANQLILQTNGMIMEARKADGNEDITVNDVTPDFLRIRGNWGGPNWEYSPNMSFDWGSSYSPY